MDNSFLLCFDALRTVKIVISLFFVLKMVISMHVHSYNFNSSTNNRSSWWFSKEEKTSSEYTKRILVPSYTNHDDIQIYSQK